MVNVIIYLKKEHSPKDLIKHLLIHRLIASASIDEDNTTYKLVEGILEEDVYNVITAQSKALLINDIIRAVEDLIGAETPINSIPIVGSNRIFNEAVRSKTIPI